MVEEQEQQKVIMYFWNNHPETRGHLFHVPNGGNRNAREASKLRGIGVIAGVPDLCLCWGGKCHWIELKVAGGRLSPAQVELHRKWGEQGVEVKVCWSGEECIGYILGIIGA